MTFEQRLAARPSLCSLVRQHANLALLAEGNWSAADMAVITLDQLEARGVELVT